MEETRFTDSNGFKALCMALGTGIVIFSLIFFSDLLQPLALGILFWYLIKALNGQIEKITIGGNPLKAWARRGISLVFITGIILGSAQIITANINQIIANYSIYQESFNSLIISVGNYLDIENFMESLKQGAGKIDIQGFLKSFLQSTSSLLGNLLLVIVYTIFIFLEENSFAKKLSTIFKERGNMAKVEQLMNRVYHSTNKYIAVKTLVSLLTAVLSYGVMIIVGVDFAFLWALLIFALNLIPYLGSFIGTLLPSVFSLLQFQSPWPFFWVFGSITVIQIVVGNYLEPKVMGSSLNLSPLIVLVSLSFWGYVWGILGLILAVPITSIMLIVMAEFPSTRTLALLLTESGALEKSSSEP